MVKILLAGDNFLTEDVLTQAVIAAIPDAELAVHLSGFPEEPFRRVSEVREATGDEDSLIQALQGCDAALVHTHPFTRRVFETCPDLKLVTVTRGGPVNVDVPAAKDCGVMVTNTPGRNAIATTEHTLAMILASVRQIAQRHNELLNGTWGGDNYRYDKAGLELSGSTIGIVGFGAIGVRVAPVCVALGMRVLVFDPYFQGEIPDGVTRVNSLDDLLAASHVVTLHARLTDENYHMIGAREIALMPDGSVIVNCARGGLLDYDALCDGLDAGHLFAAACDVFPDEPIPLGDRLLRTPRLTITPHVAGASKQCAHFAARLGAQDMARFFRGETPLHMIG